MNYAELTLREFTNRLGSEDATPGGGGASALAGCLGAALGKMVAHLTIGRKRYAGVQDDMEPLIREEEELQREFLNLISRDAEMFAPLSRAYSMPKATPEERKARDAVMEEALKDACEVPLRIMEITCRSLELAQTAAEKGSALAVSDAGDAAALCRAALQGAALNVFINTKLMKNRILAEEYNSSTDEMLEEYVPLADRILEKVMKDLRNS